MKILKRYFTRQLVTIFTMLLLVLTGLAWMIQIMSMMRFLLNYGVELDNFLGLTALMIPFIVSIILPFVTFIAVMFVYNKLISDNEITVMAASSLSPWQIARPAIIFAAVLCALHLMLNLWLVPVSQARFYNVQWNLRYGMAHMKLQESAFTQLSSGLVAYVDRVAGHDLSQVMMSDMRDPSAPITIFAEKGKLIATDRGLAIVMDNGSLQFRGNAITTGTFDTFDMDLNIAEKGGQSSFRVRRESTPTLMRVAFNAESQKQHKAILSELSTRFLGPMMNLVLALICTVVLLRSSLLRRRASFAPAAAIAAMGLAMAAFMSLSNMIVSMTQLGLMTIGVGIVIGLLIFALAKK